jgi:signal transduction histidine kinase
MDRMRWLAPVLAAAAFTVIGVIEIALDPAFRAAPLAPALALVPVVGGTLIAAVAPVAGAAVVAAMFPVATALGLDGPTGVGVLAFFLLPGWAAFRVAPGRSWLAPLAAQLMATAGVAVGALLDPAAVAGPTAPDLAAIVWENLFFSSLAWASWGVGLLARAARERAERLGRLAETLDAEREAREHEVLVAERQRIARDLHDAVAHSVSVMTLQVGAVRATMPEGAPQADMLRGIERLGRESVAELRSLVGILRDTDDVPAAAPPTIERARELVDELRAAGADVRLEVVGESRALPRAVDVSAYRVLQEALTNVLRHAPGSRATVRIDRRPAVLVVEVVNTAPGRVAVSAASIDGAGGHGLVGMRERVGVFHGRFEAGPQPDGGFAVRAEFPLEAMA